MAPLNKFHVYRQVLSLTDITLADGQEIKPQYKPGRMSQDRKNEYI
jgi:hypothetical protein